MIRRPMWLAAGAAIGVGGTMWTRRRLERLSRRVRPTAVATEIASIAGRTKRGALHKVRDALDTGRTEAQRRQDDLWHDLSARDPSQR
ncbi:MAG TPA: hypothetical protein VMU64_13995 [Acidimicrobiales bacterium]|nr:hypothetical protein [Acidimicrobiales bacterium]